MYGIFSFDKRLSHLFLESLVRGVRKIAQYYGIREQPVKAMTSTAFGGHTSASERFLHFDRIY